MILAIIGAALFIFFLATVVYTLFLSLVGLFSKTKTIEPAPGFATIAILIPAYKEDEVIVSVAESMGHLDYPQESYRVFVIADQLKDNTITDLEQLNVEVIKVVFEESTKTKSLNFALEQIDEKDYEMVLISDADNVLARSFLKKINNAFYDGYQAIQGRRVAKNLDTNFAVLDAGSEIINNHLFRKAPASIGLSSAIVGSGMAFSTHLVKSCLAEITAVGGFDKVLQLKIIERGHVICYLPDAIIFDEKISSLSEFKNQRRRWLSSQYIYLGRYFTKGIKAFMNGRLDYFNIAILQNLFFSRVINLGLLFLLTIISIALNPFLWPGTLYWGSLLVVYAASLAIALPLKFFDLRLFKALFTVPVAFFNMILFLFRLKGADKKFIHTKHSKTKIDNQLFSADETK